MDCPLCGGAASPEGGEEAATLAEVSWVAPAVLESIREEHPDWGLDDGACPACVQQALLELLLERGDEALHESIQSVWPLDSEAAFGVLPTPLRMHANPRWTGRGVTLALVDSGFHPHPDLTRPVNRIRAWADAGAESEGRPIPERFFERSEAPFWPGSDLPAGPQWHGLMTSAVAAGSGWLSHGLYRGLASDADLVLVAARDHETGRINNDTIARGLRWLNANAGRLNLGVVSVSLGGDAIDPGEPDPVGEEIERLVARGVVVIAAAGNDGQRRLVPPGSSPQAITVGGLDDHNTFDHAEVALWHSNYGEAASGAEKPELVAPGIWVVAPLLPGTSKAREAASLFARRNRPEAPPDTEERIAALKFVNPHYHHVDGTSVAAPLVASVVACMRQANPSLTPALIRSLLTEAARPVPGAPRERQGAGAIDAGRALALALREQHGALAGIPLSPIVDDEGITFLLHDHHVRMVRVVGSWDGWRSPGLPARLEGPGIWRARLARPVAGRYLYKFLLDETRWADDTDNPAKEPDGYGRLNSVLTLG